MRLLRASAMALSTGRTFWPSRRGRVFWTGLALALAASWVGRVATGGFARMEIVGAWAWLGLGARPTVFPWTGIEALR